MQRRLLILLFLPFLVSTARPQSVSLFNINSDNFPEVSADAFFFDSGGARVTPDPADVTLFEQGSPRSITSISCRPPEDPEPLSSVLVFDVSLSMKTLFASGISNLEMAKAAGHLWVNGMDLATGECAVSSFDNEGYLNQDFTTNRAALIAAIDGLQPGGQTNYNRGIVDPPGGGLHVVRNGKYRKVVVFLTDGESDQWVQYSDIIDRANSEGVTFFAVSLQMPCPSGLRMIAEQTGGAWIGSVTSIEEIETAYRTFLAEANNESPCRITWTTSACSSSLRRPELRWKGEVGRSS